MSAEKSIAANVALDVNEINPPNPVIRHIRVRHLPPAGCNVIRSGAASGKE